ncbi:MAG: hypothetical protein AABM42_08855 [Actinomycetota bacterium]
MAVPGRSLVRRGRALVAVLAAALALALGVAPSAGAQDPGRWLLTGASSIPISYFQGLTSDPAESNLFFVGVFQGLWRTTPQLHQTAGVPTGIPPGVRQAEGYNHIGDPTWNPGDGGRVLLPLECFTPGVGNTCGTGAFGVADPATLGFRYYVKLDPAEIPKAMFAETSPDGSLIWTSSGDDLLAYRSSDVSEANRGPSGPLLHAVRRLPGAVPPTGVTGAVFRKGRLLLAGEADGVYQVWSVNTDTGERRLEREMRICGESEGLDVVPTLGGELHWLIAPFDPGCQLTFGPSSALLHFIPTPAHKRYRVEVTDTDVAPLPGEVRATVHATHHGRPLRRARVTFAGETARTDKDGFATLSTTLEGPGRFRALVRRGQNYGVSVLVSIGVGQSALRVPAPRSGAG